MTLSSEESAPPMAWPAWAESVVAVDAELPSDADGVDRAMQILTGDLTPVARIDTTTGLLDRGPWRAAEAIRLLSRVSPDDDATRLVVARGVERIGVDIVSRCPRETARILGADAEGSLLELMSSPLERSAGGLLCARPLEVIGAVRVDTIAKAFDELALHDFVQWMRHYVVKQPQVVAQMRTAVADGASMYAKSLEAALDAMEMMFDAEATRRLWRAAAEDAPDWRVDLLDTRARVWGEASLPFLVADRTRQWVQSHVFQIFEGDKCLWRYEDDWVRCWRIPLKVEHRQSVLLLEAIGDHWEQMFGALAQGTRLADVVRATRPAEAMLAVPEFTSLETRRGMVACGIRGPRGKMYRIGGLEYHALDRPFAVVHWNDALMAPIGVGYASPGCVWTQGVRTP